MHFEKSIMRPSDVTLKHVGISWFCTGTTKRLAALETRVAKSAKDIVQHAKDHCYKFVMRTAGTCDQRHAHIALDHPRRSTWAHITDPLATDRPLS
jgi:hypothetical protein